MAAEAPLNVYTVTFNCGRTLVDVDAFAACLFRGNHALPDIVALLLQEVAPIAHSFLGGSLLAPYIERFVLAVQRAGSTVRYRPVASHNSGMTAALVLCRDDLPLTVRNVSKAEVGVGLWEMGNKGAAGVRLALQSTQGDSRTASLTFVAAHLAAMEDQFVRRNADWKNIVSGLDFRSAKDMHDSSIVKESQSSSDEAEPLLQKTSTESPLFVDHSPVVFGGDLNYRTSDAGPQPDDAASFPQPTSDWFSPKHYSRRLQYDQLDREKNAGKTLQLLSEEPVEFPPTYKYSEAAQKAAAKNIVMDDGEPDFYAWSTHRYPSWCDRILFSSYLIESVAHDSASPLEVQAYKALPIQPTSDHRPVALEFTLDLFAANAASSSSKQANPFPLRHDLTSRRSTARTLEIAVGMAAYLSMTWEGNIMLAATALGVVGSWWIVTSISA